MIDRKLIHRKMNLILKDLNEVKKYAALSLSEYLEDPLNEVLTERFLERIIGRMIDINYHIVTESGQPPPKDYFQSFVELGKLGILEPEFASSVAQSAGLRNRIVHDYDEIDETKVHEALQSAVQEIPLYLKAIETFLEKNKD